MDGEHAALVLQLVPLLDSAEHAAERGSARTNQQLHCALLFFLQQFRKVCVDTFAPDGGQFCIRLDTILPSP